MENEFSTEYESAPLFGNASEVTDETEKISALRWLCERHTPLSMDAFDREIKGGPSKTLGLSRAVALDIKSGSGDMRVKSG